MFDPWPLSKTEVHSTIYNSKILNLWTTKTHFKIIHGLLVSVFDKVSKPRVSRFTAQHFSRNLKNAIFFRKSKLCINERNESYIFRATSRRQSGLLVYQITLKAYKMP